jgi:hypothetical protein
MDPPNWLHPRRLPGYPIVLAALWSVFGSAIVPVVILQALVAGIVATIVMGVAGLCNRSRRVAVLAAALACFSFNGLAMAGAVMTDLVHAAAVFVGAAALLRTFARRREEWLLLTLVSWAIAQSLRPTMLLAAPLLGLLVAVGSRVTPWRPRWGRVVLVAAGLTLVPIALAATHRSNHGFLSVSAVDQKNALVLASQVAASATRGNRQEMFESWWDETESLPTLAERRAARITRARGVFARYPSRTIVTLLGNSAKLVLAPSDGLYAWATSDRERRTAPAAGLVVANLIGWIFIGLGVLRSWRGSSLARLWALSALLLGAYVLAVSCAVPAQGSRFRLPVDMLTLPLLAAGVMSILPPLPPRGIRARAAESALRR